MSDVQHELGRIPTPLPQRMADFRRRRVPLLAWLAACVTCVILLGGGGARYEYIGLAQVLEYEISALDRGQLRSLSVELYDEVQAGDVLGRLDSTEFDARLERSRATVRRLTAELDAAGLRLLSQGAQAHADWSGELRRFQADEEQHRLRILEIRVAADSGEVEQERLDLDLKRARSLFEQGLIGRADLDNADLRHDEIARRNGGNRKLLTQLEQEYRTAQERRAEFEKGLPVAPDADASLLPLRESVLIERRRMDELVARRDALVLRSPVSGQVGRVVSRPGETVLAGQTILTITERGVAQIVTFLDEADHRVVKADAPVRIASRKRPERVAESRVLRVGPGLEPMPARLWRSPTVPEFGRAVVIAGSPALELTHQERIQVDFGRP